jgi:trehalose 6-phosphate phosphatase
VGLHGAEEAVLGRPAARPALDAHADALRSMRDRVPRRPGVVVEDKGGEAFAVHYRRAVDADAARGALADWAAGSPAGLEAVWGKRVVELRPVGVSKGAAVSRLAAAHPDRTPVYIGDDVTDEDAFAALAEDRPESITIRVGRGPTKARFRLPDVASVMEYLRRFVG